MTVIQTTAGAGIFAGRAATHETPEDWRAPKPPASLWSEAMNREWADYSAIRQRIGDLGHEKNRLYDLERDAEALEADERLAAALPLDADVPTANLDKLTTDRRRNLVAGGAAARAADAAIMRMREVRRTDALDPAAGEATDKARTRAAKLAAELEPLLQEIVNWRAAVAWSQGQPYRPDHALVSLAQAIARDLDTQE